MRFTSSQQILDCFSRSGSGCARLPQLGVSVRSPQTPALSQPPPLPGQDRVSSPSQTPPGHPPHSEGSGAGVGSCLCPQALLRLRLSPSWCPWLQTPQSSQSLSIPVCTDSCQPFSGALFHTPSEQLTAPTSRPAPSDADLRPTAVTTSLWLVRGRGRR